MHPQPAPTTVAFYTLGCKVNQAETDSLIDEFRAARFQCTSFDSHADVYIINTCTVTHTGDAKSRQILRQARRMNPNALVVATGCYASIVRENMPVDGVLVVRNRDKDRLLDIVRKHISTEEQPPITDKPAQQGLAPASMRSRPMVKVQDGCDSACSYCIIPRSRGRSRSVPPHTVINRVRHLSDSGHEEVVITGVDLGSYGSEDSSLPDLGQLLEAILAETEVHRVRVSSLEPGDFDLRWLDLWRSGRLCRHLHLPLQAGSDGALLRMRRQYDTSRFAEVISACREAVSDLAITTDIITGFPGETNAEFESGLAFIDQCAFDGMHVFPYSLRPGTAAAKLADHVNDRIKKERAAVLRERAASALQAHVQANVGTTQEVVWESHRDGVWRGTTDNNVRAFTYDPSLSTQSDRRLLSAVYSEGCWAEPIGVPDLNMIPLVAV